MKEILFLSIFIGMVFHCSPSRSAENDKDIKKTCKEAQSQLVELQKELDLIQSERQSLDQKLMQARNRFEGFRNQFSGMKGCSQGNPSNSAACNQTLEGLKNSGEEMTQIQKQKAQLAPKKLAIENQMFKPQGQIKTYSCQ